VTPLAVMGWSQMESVEVTRARYRPDRIKTLFVGESASASGANVIVASPLFAPLYFTRLN